MPVPNTFANATATIPLSQLDANFATTITLGNTAIQLGNTVSTLNNMTLANVTVTSGNVTITNVTVTTANVTTANIATAQIANVTVSGTSTFAAGSNTAPSITFSGDTNTGIYSPGADTVAIATGGTAAVTVNSSQQLSFGSTTNPWSSLYSRAIYIEAGSGKPGAIAVGTAGWTGGRSIWLTNNAYTSSAGTYRYVSSGGLGAGLLQVGNDSLTFNGAPSGTADTDITFTQVFDVARGETFALQGATRTSGTGITFPATQSASTNANTLDDYEEGTFTATLSPGTSGSITLNSIYDLLSYTKIGRLVTITGQLVVSSVSSPVGSLVNLNNLPFPCADTGELSERAGGCTTYVDNSANAYYTQGMLLAAGDTFTRILMSEAGRVAAIAADDGFVFSFSYITST